jgi:hypothetical protein
MKTTRKSLVLSVALAGILGAAGSALADSAVKAPIRLTDAQMDRIVAGADFPWSTTTNSTTQVFQGYSTQPQHSPNGQGTSSIITTSTTTTTLRCTGASINSCFTGQTPAAGTPVDQLSLNPQTEVITVTSNPVITTTGPGKSPSLKIFMNQGRL